jgi:hypothetical protein
LSESGKLRLLPARITETNYSISNVSTLAIAPDKPLAMPRSRFEFSTNQQGAIAAQLVFALISLWQILRRDRIKSGGMGVILDSTMVTELMVQPSSWVETGIIVETVRGLKLFKFTEELQNRFEELIDLCKQAQLTAEQEAELKGLSELDRIFTLLNARAIAES